MSEVTIVVTTRERPAWLAVALRSIRASAALARTKPRLLVVDDASADDAARVVASRFGAEYHRQPERGGCARARAWALGRIDSPYFAFFDDDDVMLPRWFAAHLRRMAEGHDVVSSSFWFADAMLRRTKRHILTPVTLAGLLAGEVSANDFSLVRRAALEGITLHPERDTVMMMSLWLALAAAGKRFATIAEPTFLYRRHGGNLTNALPARDAEWRALAISEFA